MPSNDLLGHETVVVHVADHARVADSVGRVADRLHIRIAELADKRGLGVGGVGDANPPVDFLVLSILVVVVLVGLAGVVRRIGDDDFDRRLAVGVGPARCWPR